MQLLQRFLQYHKEAILVAVIVSFVAGLPQVIARQQLGSADRGIPFLVANDSEAEYLGRIHEILDGHWNVASPMLYEYKDSTILIPPTGELFFYVLPMKLFGLSLVQVVFWSKVFYPAILFLLVYLFIFSLLNKKDFGARWSAIAGALLITIGYDATNFRSLVTYFLHGTNEPARLLWNRLVNPITGGLLLFAFLGLFSRIVQEKGRWLTVMVAALVLAAMPGYIFSFALGLTIVTLMSFYSIWRRNWPLLRQIGTPVVVALLLNIFYFSGVFLAMSKSLALSDPRKSGMFFTHQPLVNIISYLTLVVVVFCFLFYFKKDSNGEKEKRWWFLALATILACVVAYNQQLITGRTVWPQHFAQYTKPLAMAIMTVFLHNILRSRAKNLWRIAVVALLFISGLSGWRILATVRYNHDSYAELQSFAEVLDYLNANASKDCVVYVSSDYRNQINRYIPALTSCNVYYTYYSFNGVPAERVMHNYLVNLRLRGIKLKDAQAHFNYEPDQIFMKAYFFRDWKDLFCCNDKWLAKISDSNEIDRWYASVGQDVAKQYAEYLKKDLYSELTQYRLDYLVVDIEKQPQVNAQRYPFLSLQGKFGKFAIYKLD